MPNPLNLRILSWPFKLVYGVVAFGVSVGLLRLLALLHVGGIVTNVLSLILLTGAFVYGARVFRGRNEDVAAPRAWWQMTARRPLSKRLGVLFTVLASLELIGVLLGILSLAGVAVGRRGATDDNTVPIAFATVQLGILAFLYLKSARHLPVTYKVSYMGDSAFQVDRLYGFFNARLAGEAVRFLHPEVEWPNGWEGGYLHGRSGVREYWERQWKQISPQATPLGIHVEEDGQLTVRVRQVVHDRTGVLISDTELEHVYRSRDGLFDRMEIRELPVR
jgi:hypothetical protein